MTYQIYYTIYFDDVDTKKWCSISLYESSDKGVCMATTEQAFNYFDSYKEAYQFVTQISKPDHKAAVSGANYELVELDVQDEKLQELVRNLVTTMDWLENVLEDYDRYEKSNRVKKFFLDCYHYCLTFYYEKIKRATLLK